MLELQQNSICFEWRRRLSFKKNLQFQFFLEKISFKSSHLLRFRSKCVEIIFHFTNIFLVVVRFGRSANYWPGEWSLLFSGIFYEWPITTIVP